MFGCLSNDRQQLKTNFFGDDANYKGDECDFSYYEIFERKMLDYIDQIDAPTLIADIMFNSKENVISWKALNKLLTFHFGPEKENQIKKWIKIPFFNCGRTKEEVKEAYCLYRNFNVKLFVLDESVFRFRLINDIADETVTNKDTTYFDPLTIVFYFLIFSNYDLTKKCEILFQFLDYESKGYISTNFKSLNVILRKFILVQLFSGDTCLNNYIHEVKRDFKDHLDLVNKNNTFFEAIEVTLNQNTTVTPTNLDDTEEIQILRKLNYFTFIYKKALFFLKDTKGVLKDFITYFAHNMIFYERRTNHKIDKSKFINLMKLKKFQIFHPTSVKRCLIKYIQITKERTSLFISSVPKFISFYQKFQDPQLYKKREGRVDGIPYDTIAYLDLTKDYVKYQKIFKSPDNYSFIAESIKEKNKYLGLFDNRHTKVKKKKTTKNNTIRSLVEGNDEEIISPGKLLSSKLSGLVSPILELKPNFSSGKRSNNSPFKFSTPDEKENPNRGNKNDPTEMPKENEKVESNKKGISRFNNVSNKSNKVSEVNLNSNQLSQRLFDLNPIEEREDQEDYFTNRFKKNSQENEIEIEKVQNSRKSNKNIPEKENIIKSLNASMSNDDSSNMANDVDSEKLTKSKIERNYDKKSDISLPKEGRMTNELMNINFMSTNSINNPRKTNDLMNIAMSNSNVNNKSESEKVMINDKERELEFNIINEKIEDDKEEERINQSHVSSHFEILESQAGSVRGGNKKNYNVDIQQFFDDEEEEEEMKSVKKSLKKVDVIKNKDLSVKLSIPNRDLEKDVKIIEDLNEKVNQGEFTENNIARSNLPIKTDEDLRQSNATADKKEEAKLNSNNNFEASPNKNDNIDPEIKFKQDKKLSTWSDISDFRDTVNSKTFKPGKLQNSDKFKASDDFSGIDNDFLNHTEDDNSMLVYLERYTYINKQEDKSGAGDIANNVNFASLINISGGERESENDLRKKLFKSSKYMKEAIPEDLNENKLSLPQNNYMALSRMSNPFRKRKDDTEPHLENGEEADSEYDLDNTSILIDIPSLMDNYFKMFSKVSLGDPEKTKLRLHKLPRSEEKKVNLLAQKNKESIKLYNCKKEDLFEICNNKINLNLINYYMWILNSYNAFLIRNKLINTVVRFVDTDFFKLVQDNYISEGDFGIVLKDYKSLLFNSDEFFTNSKEISINSYVLIVPIYVENPLVGLNNLFLAKFEFANKKIVMYDTCDILYKNHSITSNYKIIFETFFSYLVKNNYLTPEYSTWEIEVNLNCACYMDEDFPMIVLLHVAEGFSKDEEVDFDEEILYEQWKESIFLQTSEFYLKLSETE